MKVYRNDEISVEKIAKFKNLKAIILSPGPGNPDEAVFAWMLLTAFTKSYQYLVFAQWAIGQYFGGKVIKAKRQIHGKASVITNNTKGIFKDLDKNFSIIRHHSLIVERKKFTL